MSDTTINPTLLQDLKAGLHGQLIVPGDDAYESARRVWNGMIDKHPGLIVRCADVSDVVRCIQFARSQQLPVAIRGGGHSYAGKGTCDDGLVIDLSPMKQVRLDPVKRIAQAQAGLLLGEYIRQTEAFGLVTPVGIFSDTGLSGLTLGGGLGFLMGKYGLTIDNMLSVEIVTARGQVLRASADEHPDLFWAVRGGGGNFGVVTSFEFRLHPLESLLLGLIAYPLEQAEEVWRAYREFTRTAPDELTAYAPIGRLPNGSPAVGVMFCYCGAQEEGERLVAPLRSIGKPLMEMIRPASYSEVISLFDAATPRGRHYYSKTRSLRWLYNHALETLIAYAQARPSPLTQISIQHVHGAVCRVDPGETAFRLRDEHYEIHIMAAWDADAATSDAEKCIRWARDLWTDLGPFAAEEAYINYMEDEGEARVRASYGAHYERLVHVKNKYDPQNFFHLNQNIKPTVQQ
jgi:UDP-N-acetylenolpyruvoylglucosamine reductase